MFLLIAVVRLTYQVVKVERRLDALEFRRKVGGRY